MAIDTITCNKGKMYIKKKLRGGLSFSVGCDRYNYMQQRESYMTLIIKCIKNARSWPQLDACLTGDQEVTGLTPAESATFICGEIFSKIILSLLLIQEGQLSVSGKRMHAVLVTA